MTNLRKMMLTTVLGVFIATPIFALDVPVDVKLGAMPEDMTTLKMVEDSAFKGNEVRTKDQIVVGKVDGVTMDAKGNMLVVITLSGDISAKSSVKTFSVPLAKDTTSDGSLTLGWNETELFAALSGNLEPMGASTN